MYKTISKYYDMMYVNDESYRSEVDKVVSLVKQYKKSNGNMNSQHFFDRNRSNSY